MSRCLKILITLVIALILAFFILWSLLPTLVSKELSKQAGVPITMETFQLSSSLIHIDNLNVKNPPMYTLPKALSVATIDIYAPFSRFFAPKIILDKLELDTIYVGIEFDSKNSKQGNWTTIMNHLGGDDPKKGQKEVIIKKLILTNLSIELAYRDGSAPPKKLQKIKRIELDNVSSEGGIPSSVVMKIIMREALHNIFSKEGIQNMIQDSLKQNLPTGPSNLFKGFFGNACPEANLSD
ncbi:MAG: hypothetical protein KBC64_02760 [Simkaniaceae bacterium]|nr:hypothetical protein [Simkaniaceae bacterium]